MHAPDRNADDAELTALLHAYIELYARESLPRWRELFLAEFVALSTNRDGSATTWSLEEFYERQRSAFATGKPIREVLENVTTERRGGLVHVGADFVWTDGDLRRRGTLMLLIVEHRAQLRIQSLAFGYDP